MKIRHQFLRKMKTCITLKDFPVFGQIINFSAFRMCKKKRKVFINKMLGILYYDSLGSILI